jgi:hypothetical protein
MAFLADAGSLHRPADSPPCTTPPPAEGEQAKAEAAIAAGQEEIKELERQALKVMELVEETTKEQVRRLGWGSGAARLLQGCG